jgi:hypothetical protein
MQTVVARSETPAGVGMVILHNLPYDPSGKPLDGSLVSQLTVTPALSGHPGVTGQVTPKKLSRAGFITMLAAINTYLSGLTAAQQDAINTQIPGGLSVTITPTLVQVPCAASGVATLSASMATVLSTGGNLTAL